MWANLPRGRTLEPVLQVEASDGESVRKRAFKVTIKYAVTLDIQALVDFVR